MILHNGNKYYKNMKITHTLSAIEATAYALEHCGKIEDVNFSRVKPEKTTLGELKAIQEISVNLSIEIKNKLEQVLDILKHNKNEETIKAYKIIDDLLY